MLKGTQIYLRALELSDLDFLYQLENDTHVWEMSNTIAPYSKKVLRMYLDNAHRDIYEVKQLRLCITTNTEEVVGLIDLFDFDPKNRRAGMGIVVLDAANRNKGIGAEAISLLCEYAFDVLDLNQIYANIIADNAPSLALFEKLGFVKAGIKKQWVRTKDGFKDELLYQKMKNVS